MPVGVPVRMTSPGSSVMKREMSAMRSAKEKMRLEETSSWTISPLTRVRRTSPCGSTSAAATAGPIGVKPSWPLEKRLEPRSFQRKSAMPASLAAANQPTCASASSGATRCARVPMTTAISPSYPSSSVPRGRTRSPSPANVDGGLRK